MIVTLEGNSLELIKGAVAVFKQLGFPNIQIQDHKGDTILAVLGSGANSIAFIPNDRLPQGVKYCTRNDGYFNHHFPGFEEEWLYIANRERREKQSTVMAS